MNFYLILVFSASVFIPGIIGLIRFQKMDTHYYPFLYFIWAGCVNEAISIALAMKSMSNYINSNIYVLLAAFFLTWFFKEQRLFDRYKGAFFLMLFTFITVWLIEVFLWKGIKEISSYFRIVFSLGVVFMSIRMINTILVSGNQKILQNALFLLCLLFTFYFTYKVIVEAFWMYGLKSSTSFQLLIWNISVYVNLFTNLIYAVAILWIPRKQLSILPS
jgi:hypothetical protein